MNKFLNSLPTNDEVAKEHAAADRRCGRKWECACPSCRQVRAERDAMLQHWEDLKNSK